MIQKIIPHLWYDTQAKEAAEFYVNIFPSINEKIESKINSVYTLHNTPSGNCDVISFKIWGYEFMSISAGPYFKFNPSVSFMVNFDPSKDSEAETKIDVVWKKLSEGGKILMPLDKYPFSKRYGWLQDKYGLSWQLSLTNPEAEERPFIIPSILFVGPNTGKAEEATEFYLSVFSSNGDSATGETNSKRGAIVYYPAGAEPDKEGTVMFTDFTIEGQWFSAMDSARMHDFNFSEAISLIINSESQKEIDYFWQKLSADPKSEQCGWLKDKFGFSWQVSPTELQNMLKKGTPEQVDRVTKAFLGMKKFNLEKLKQEFEGR